MVAYTKYQRLGVGKTLTKRIIPVSYYTRCYIEVAQKEALSRNSKQLVMLRRWWRGFPWVGQREVKWLLDTMGVHLAGVSRFSG